MPDLRFLTIAGYCCKRRASIEPKIAASRMRSYLRTSSKSDAERGAKSLECVDASVRLTAVWRGLLRR